MALPCPDIGFRIIPQIALLMGPCLGGQAYHPIMQDFIIQCRKTGFMAIAGPASVKTQTGEDISMEELCGVTAHAVKSGSTHVVAEDDKDCMDKAKALLALLPSNNKECPPRIPTDDDPDRIIPDFENIVPAQPFKAFDMHLVIARLVDNGYFYEIMKTFARNVIVGFGRSAGAPPASWRANPHGLPAHRL